MLSLFWKRKPLVKQCLKCRRWMLSDVGNRICEKCEQINKSNTDGMDEVKLSTGGLPQGRGDHESS